MNDRAEWQKLAAVIAVFLTFFYLPVGNLRFDNAILEALHLAKWYAQEHVLLCLIPAFFIAGAILFSIVIGLLMHLIFLKEESEGRPLQNALRC